jgi:hypothetical protein
LFDKLDAVVDRYEHLTEKLADPSIYERQKEFKEVSSERANIEEVVKVYKEYKQVKADIDEAKDILKNEKDEDMREMAKEELSEKEGLIPDFEDRLKLKFVPVPVGMRPRSLWVMFIECTQTIFVGLGSNQKWFRSQKVTKELKKLSSLLLGTTCTLNLSLSLVFIGCKGCQKRNLKDAFIPQQLL